MAKTVKIKVKLEKNEPVKTLALKKPKVEYSSTDDQPWEMPAVHRHLAEHQLNLDPWLDEVTKELASGSQDLINESKITPIAISEPMVIVEETAEPDEILPTNSQLSAEKHKAIEDLFFSKPSEKHLSFKPTRSEEKLANPVIMLWYIIKERVNLGFVKQWVNFLATGWWLVPVWLVGEWWWLSKQQTWSWPHGVWVAISWLWPLVCWGVLSWLRSNFAITVKDFLSSLWPLALISSIAVAIIEIFWQGGLWTWLNLITLPLLVLAIIAASSWWLAHQGRLNN